MHDVDRWYKSAQLGCPIFAIAVVVGKYIVDLLNNLAFNLPIYLAFVSWQWILVRLRLLAAGFQVVFGFAISGRVCMRVYSMAFEMKASLHNINSEATCIYLPPLKIVVCLRTTFAKILIYFFCTTVLCACVASAGAGAGSVVSCPDPTRTRNRRREYYKWDARGAGL